MVPPKQNSVIDLRSDTITQPTEKMRQAMASAEVGDDGYRDDPTVNRLETLAADRLGKEAGLFVTSGTMGNLVALLTHTGRGGEILLGEDCHILRSEMGSIASVAGLFHRSQPGPGGQMDIDQIASTIRPHVSARELATSLICVENTHGASGGRVLPMAYLSELSALARANLIPVHMDGARLFNAATFLQEDVAAIAGFVDSVTFCLSKGLSAPFGSILAGPTVFIERARTFRRMLGGMMRQAGIMASAGIIALQEMSDRLGEDHRRARELADMLCHQRADLCDPSQVETNMVLVDLPAESPDSGEWVETLRNRNILCAQVGVKRLRLVTNRHIDDQAIQTVGQAFSALL